MQLEHSFTVPVGIDEAWKILLDIELIGPCMPGAAIDSVDGDEFTGSVKVKLGPINLTYKGQAKFVEKDEVSRRAVIDARGRDARGNGTASALVTATLTEDSGATTVRVNTDLDITGKPAQFGRGVMVDVGNKLIGQFADRLAETIRGGGATPAADAAAAQPPGAAAEGAQPAKKARPKPPPRHAAAEAPAGAPAPEVADPVATEPKMAQPEVAAPEPAAPEQDEPAATESAAAESGPAEATADAPPAADVEAVETTPSYSVPGGVRADSVSSVNGHEPRSGGQPRREVEPINLLDSAGPAVAKRLAPVAVGLVVVLLAASRRRKRS